MPRKLSWAAAKPTRVVEAMACLIRFSFENTTSVFGAQKRPELRDRFRREAEAVARLQHANIVQIYEVGEHEGRLFFSMEFIGGGSLAQRLAQGSLPIESSVVLVAALARAIFHCHQRGIIHRDLKPANILLEKADAGCIPDQAGAEQQAETVVMYHP